MNEKKTYKVNTQMNFSIADAEFYLVPGVEVELPEHELISSLLIRKHIELIEKTEDKKTKK